MPLTSIFLSALVRICITTTELHSLGFQRLLPTQQDIEKLFSVPGLSITPDLFTMLRARDLPTLAWFKGLPFCETNKDWVVSIRSARPEPSKRSTTPTEIPRGDVA